MCVVKWPVTGGVNATELHSKRKEWKGLAVIEQDYTSRLGVRIRLKYDDDR